MAWELKEVTVTVVAYSFLFFAPPLSLDVPILCPPWNPTI